MIPLSGLWGHRLEWKMACFLSPHACIIPRKLPRKPNAEWSLLQLCWGAAGSSDTLFETVSWWVVFHRVCPEPNPRRNTMSVSLPDTLTYNRLIVKNLRKSSEIYQWWPSIPKDHNHAPENSQRQGWTKIDKIDVNWNNRINSSVINLALFQFNFYFCENFTNKVVWLCFWSSHSQIIYLLETRLPSQWLQRP